MKNIELDGKVIGVPNNLQLQISKYKSQNINANTNTNTNTKGHWDALQLVNEGNLNEQK